MSLRTRLFLGLTLLVVAAVGSATWAIGVLGQHRIEVALSGRVLELAQPILATLEEATTLAEASVRATRLQQRGVAQEIVLGDPSGQRSDGGVADPRMVAAASSAPFVVHSGEQAFAYAPLRRDGRLFGVVRIRAGSDDSTRLWRELAPLAWAIALVDIGLILLFGGLFLRRVIDPLRGLSDAAMRVAEGALDVAPLPPHPNDDELGRLIRAFNEMTRSLREQREQVVAQAKLATVGRLAAGVAHEVGNPLSAIVGYLAMLRQDVERLGAEVETRELVDRAAREAERMRTLIAELVDYARPVPPKQEPVELGPLVAATCELLRPQRRMRDVLVEIAPSLPTVRGDAARLQQVMINLLLNGADAMSGHGKIRIWAEVHDDRCDLLVEDEGPGVKPEQRALLFDPFFTTKPPGEGTGLGLAVSRSIVEALGGRIELVPSERGARFAIRLPLAARPAT